MTLTLSMHTNNPKGIIKYQMKQKMKFFQISVLLFVFIQSLTFAQNNEIKTISIKGVITDFNGGIPYVSVGIEGKNIGTLTDSIGNYEIKITNQNLNDTLTFLCFGYETKKILIKTIKNNICNVILEKNKKIVELSEVVIIKKSPKRKKIILGKTNKTEEFGTTWGKREKGSEIARLIKVKNNTKFYLNTTNIYLSILKGKEIDLIVTIYEQDSLTMLPGKAIKREIVKLKLENIQVEEEFGNHINGWLKTDFSKYKLSFDKPFFVAYQSTRNILNFKQEIYYDTGASKSGCYIRTSNFHDWEKSNGFGYVINCEGSYIKKEKIGNLNL